MQAMTTARRFHTRLTLGVVLALLLGLQLDALGQSIRLPSPEQRQDAAEFPEDFDWLNTNKPLALDGNLKGHIVILDFWTYCCINCMHILPDLHYIEHKYEDEPVVVVGVHSAKFEIIRSGTATTPGPGRPSPSSTAPAGTSGSSAARGTGRRWIRS